MKRSALKLIGGALGVVAIAASSWRVRDWVVSKALKLPPAENEFVVERGLVMKTPDGVTLVGDLFRPKTDSTHPTIVVRTAYQRSTVSGAIFSKFFASRGYNVFVQDVRGTGDSSGDFVPLVNERIDGKATIEWIEQQPWFNGQIGTFGPSYLGYTSNAIAVHNQPAVKAAFSTIAPRTFRDILYGNGGFDFNTALYWTVVVDTQQKAKRVEQNVKNQLLEIIAGFRGPQISFDTLPIASADSVATGAPVDFYQSFIASADLNAPLWQADTLTEAEVGGIEAPVFLSSNWHDTALPDVLCDYHALTAAGKNPRLTICSGPHGSPRALLHYLRDGKAWFDHHLKGQPLQRTDNALPILRDAKPVQFNILDTKEWIEADRWPVPAVPKPLYLDANGTLADSPTSQTQRYSTYVYDPMNPTPAVGGNLLDIQKPVVDNATLEARADTLTFTAPQFETPTYVIGIIKAIIQFEADVETADLFVRVNRVSAAGRSTNVTDAVRRVFFDSENGGVQEVELELVPTAVRFEKGEQLRLVIASGAHPRTARNLGSGSTQAQAFMTEGKRANVKVWFSAENPSHIELPIANQFVKGVKGIISK